MSHRIFEFDPTEKGAFERDEITAVSIPSTSPQSTAALFSCPDCAHRCSQYAEACPRCGRFFRGYGRIVEVVPGSGWIGKVAWGIVLSSFLWGLILMSLFVVGVIVLVLLFGAGAALTPRR